MMGTRRSAKKPKPSPTAAPRIPPTLSFRIYNVEGIDPRQAPTSPKSPREYKFYAWISNGEELTSQPAVGRPDPSWNSWFFLPLDGLVPKPDTHLHLEIVKKLSQNSTDAAPSSGYTLVGKLRIPLTGEYLSAMKSETFDLKRLVGVEQKLGGSVRIAMRILGEKKGSSGIKRQSCPSFQKPLPLRIL